MSVFVHAQGIKTVHAGGGGGKKGQNSVHVVVECPLRQNVYFSIRDKSIYNYNIFIERLD